MAHLARQRFAGVRLAQQVHAGVEPAAVDDGVLGVPGRKQHGDAGQAFARLARQLGTAQRAGHHHVGKQQVDRHAAVDDGQRAGGVARLEHPVTEFAQHLDHGGAHAFVIFGHQDGLLAADHGARFRRRRGVLDIGGARQVQLDRGAATGFAVDLHMAAGLAHEAIHHRQSQAAALAFRLGGKERVEGLRHDFGRHAGAGVADGDHHVLAGRQFRVVPCVVVVEHGVAYLDGELAHAVHGVARVDAQVEHRVFHLGGIDQRVPQAARDHGFHLDLLAQATPQHVFHAGDEAADAHHARIERLAPAERQQVAGQLGATGDAGQRLFHAALGARHVGHVGGQQLQVAGDDLQQVVEVVRHAAGEFADRFHLLRLLQFERRAAHLFGGRPFRRHVAAHGVDEALVGHGGPGQDGMAAALAQRAVLELEGAVALRQRVHFGNRRLGVVRVHDLVDRGTDDLRLVPAQQAGKGRIGGGDPAVERGHQHDIGGVAPHAVALRRALGHLQLQFAGGGFLILDVGAGAYPSLHHAVVVDDGHGAHDVPAPGAVRAADPVFDLEVLRGGDRGTPGSGHLLAVVAVDNDGPGIAGQLPRLGAGIAVHLLVEPVERAVGVGRPHLAGNRLGQGAEGVFTGAQLLLGADLVGGVHHYHQHPERLARFVQDRCVVEVHPHLLRFAGAQQRHFLVLVRQRAAGQRHADHVGVVLGHLGPRLPRLGTERRRMAAAGKLGVAVVIDHHAVLAQQRHHGQRGAQHGRNGGLERLRPGVDRAQRGAGPVVGGDDLRDMAAAVEEGIVHEVTGLYAVRNGDRRL